MKTKKTKGKLYEADLKVLGKHYKAKGDTIIDTIKALTPGRAMAMGILTINGKERILNPRTMVRLFSTRGLTQEVALKNASILFDGV